MTKQPKISLVKCYPSFYTVPFLFFCKKKYLLSQKVF